MFVVENSGWQSYFLLLLILVFWGVWPALRRISNDASSQAFSVVMVFSQYVTTCGICFFLGSITERGSSMFPEPSFAWAIVDDSGKTLSILLLLVGGCCIAYGDSAATMAIEHLGLALGGPMVFGISLSFGTAFDFVLQRKNTTSEAVLLFMAVVCVFWAIYIDACSHEHNMDKAKTAPVSLPHQTLEKNKKMPYRKCKSMINMDAAKPQSSLLAIPQHAFVDVECSKKSMEIPLLPNVATHAIPRPRAIKLALAWGMVMACWSACSTAATDVDSMYFYSLFFWFQTGEVIGIVPSVMMQLKIAGDPKNLRDVLREIRSMTLSDVACSATAGIFVAVGYFCYFATSDTIPRATAFAFGSCSPIVNKAVAYVFREYDDFSWKGKFYLLFSAFLYAVAIYLLYLSTKDLAL